MTCEGLEVLPLLQDGRTTAVDEFGTYLSSRYTQAAVHAATREQFPARFLLSCDGPSPSHEQAAAYSAALSVEEDWWERAVTLYKLAVTQQQQQQMQQPSSSAMLGGLPRLSSQPSDNDDDVASLREHFDEESVEDTALGVVGLSVDATVARRVAAVMRRRVEQSGGLHCFPTLRRVVWGFFTGTVQRSPSQVEVQRAQYRQLVAQVADPDVADVILRDLGRTMPSHCLFRDLVSPGQTSLCRILHAYSIFDPVVGYCQGMGFLAATLLLHMSEEDSFWVLVHMMHGPQFAMRRLYLPGFPMLQQFFCVLRHLIARLEPSLHRHLNAEGVDVAFFASQWFMTLFACQLPMRLVGRVWDLFFSRGWPVVFQVALATLHWDAASLLELPMEGILLFLREAHEQKLDDELIQRALDVPVTEDDLRRAIEQL